LGSVKKFHQSQIIAEDESGHWMRFY